MQESKIILTPIPQSNGAIKNRPALILRKMPKYQPQLKRAIAAISILETASPDSDEFCNALAELHVCSTILEPYSEGMLEAIEQFTEDDSISTL